MLIEDITERKRSEDELRESEEQFSKIFRASPIAISIADTLDGKLTEVNDASCKLMGYSKEEAIGSNVEELKIIDHEQRNKLREKFLSNGAFRLVENEITTKSGEKKSILTSAELITIRENKFSINLVIDITERKQAEEALLSSKTFLDSIIEHSPYAMWISDSRGTLMRLNQACRNLLHITDDEVVGKYNILQDTIVAEQGYLPMVKQVFEKRTTVNFIIVYNSEQLGNLELGEHTSLVLDVTISPVLDTDGNVIHAIVQHKDITERQTGRKRNTNRA